jgi:hypothetical protein
MFNPDIDTDNMPFHPQQIAAKRIHLSTKTMHVLSQRGLPCLHFRKTDFQVGTIALNFSQDIENEVFGLIHHEMILSYQHHSRTTCPGIQAIPMLTLAPA